MLQYCLTLVLDVSVLAHLHLSRLKQSLSTLAESLFTTSRAIGVGIFFLDRYNSCRILVFFSHVLHGESWYRLGVIGDYLQSGWAQVSKNLTMYKVPKRNGLAILSKTLKTALTRESPNLTCNVIVSTTLTFWLVPFFNADRLFCLYGLKPFCLDELFSDKVRPYTCGRNAIGGMHLASHETNRN